MLLEDLLLDSFPDFLDKDFFLDEEPATSFAGVSLDRFVLDLDP